MFSDLYRRSLAEAGHDPADFPVAVHGLGYVADNTEEAVETVWPTFSAMMTKIGRERGWGPLTRDQFEWMASPEGSLVVGDPPTVAAKIDHWREILGIERFMLHNAGSIDHERSLRSIELLGTKVRPLLS